MSLFDAARHRLRTLFRPGTADRERDEEFAFHQSLAETDHVHATGDASDAHAVARRAFGNQTYFKEQLRWMGAMRWVDQFGQDLRFAPGRFGDHRCLRLWPSSPSASASARIPRSSA